MNLIIDQGNSAAKIALFQGNDLVKVFHEKALSDELLLKIIQEFQPKAGIFCSVKSYKSLKTYKSFYELTHQLPLPITTTYQTPETLGMDRLAAAAGAAAQKPETPLLIIDIGTAITIDYVSAEGVYKGGNISPGVELRFKSLNQFTDRLPLISEDGDIPPLGYNTETAIRSGVIEGIVRELDSYMDEYKKNHNIFTFLTGGHAFYFESKLKNAIFADENLVLKGLNEILNYQQK